ncbi:MAG: pilus assembly protein [Desulfobulbaceae bacterium]|nr:pilus assembly protein [Desulfobulbaceae bacterium]
MELLFALALFAVILLAFWGGYALFLKPEKGRSLYGMVAKYSPRKSEGEYVDLYYHRKLSDIPFLQFILERIPLVRSLDSLMQQAGVNMLAGVFILLCLVAAAFTYLIGSLWSKHVEVALGLALLALILPYVLLLFRRRRQRFRFEALFPDALDLMGYSLKAGHSIMASLRMVAEEMAAPVGPEFARVVEEINFGNSFETTLQNFARRVDSAELRYFVTSVIIQRETGANLVEILEKISETIRRKFRFREKTRSLTAEARLSAMILTGLPFFVAIAVSLTNRKYIMVLTTDPLGPYLIAVAAVMMVFGIIVMYRLVQIDL